LQPLWEVVLLVVLLPIMSDEAMIVDKTGSIFLQGVSLVKAAAKM
jgi:acetyl-CoA carboxylase carboxyltransferase component